MSRECGEFSSVHDAAAVGSSRLRHLAQHPLPAAFTVQSVSAAVGFGEHCLPEVRFEAPSESRPAASFDHADHRAVPGNALGVRDECVPRGSRNNHERVPAALLPREHPGATPQRAGGATR